MANSEERTEVIAKDIPEIVALLTDLNEKLTDANTRVAALIEKVDSNEFSTEEGVSFLEMKFHLLLSYLVNLVHYMLLKSHGRSIENSSTVDRLVELRTVMEKIRPIDQKLKYQIEKLIKIATTGIVGQENDPLRFKPRPDNLVSKLENIEDGGEEEKKRGIYVPPKVAAMHYDDEPLSRHQKSKETARRKALSSSLLKELRDEYSEAPEELKEGEFFNKGMEKEIDDDKDQRRYEEDNLVRLMSKKRGKSIKRQPQSLENLTKFTDLSVLTKNINVGDESDASDNENRIHGTRKKRKSRLFGGKSGSRKKRKGSFKRRH